MAEHGFVTSPPATTGSDAGRRAATITIRRWHDPAVDRRGHDPRSRYVERFWLGVLGPSATWLARRLADELGAAGDEAPRLDLSAVAQSMGMSYTPGRTSAFGRAIQRCVMFGIAEHTGDGLAIRQRFPDVAERQLRRLPPSVSREHDDWVAARVRHEPATGTDRARVLARAMIDVGDCLDQLEGQLASLGIEPGEAERVVDDLRRETPAVSAA